MHIAFFGVCESAGYHNFDTYSFACLVVPPFSCSATVRRGCSPAHRCMRLIGRTQTAHVLICELGMERLLDGVAFCKAHQFGLLRFPTLGMCLPAPYDIPCCCIFWPWSMIHQPSAIMGAAAECVDVMGADVPRSFRVSHDVITCQMPSNFNHHRRPA